MTHFSSERTWDVIYLGKGTEGSKNGSGGKQK